jgi:Cu-Zn family superoxide dismutase
MGRIPGMALRDPPGGGISHNVGRCAWRRTHPPRIGRHFEMKKPAPFLHFAACLRSSIITFLAISALVLGTSCRQKDPTDTNAPSDSQATLPQSPTPVRPSDNITKAVATIVGTDGNNVSGTVSFTKESGGVRVVADLNGLSPGEHGFHIHENGDCSGDGSAAGGHFNPTNQPHGSRDADKRHVGDLGNLKADESGHARVEFVDSKLELSGPNTIVNRALMIHGGRDDLTSQPSGDAGSRVACGVIVAGTERM